MSHRVRALLVAAAVGVVVVALALSVLVSGGADPEPSSTPSTGATTTEPTEPPERSLSDIATLTTAVTRDTFCADVADEAVETALGGPATATTEYGDGQNVQVTGRVRDIAHEFGCTWTASSTATRAWVFAPPVTRRTATSLVRDARRGTGCRTVAGAPDFGATSIALTCRTSRGVEASYRGLFGDAWLTCAVADRTAGRDEVAARAERWCVAVLDAAS